MQDVSPATRAGSRALSLPSMRDATVASCAVFFFLVSHFWYPSHAARPYDGSYQNWLFENTKGQLLVSFAEEYAGNHAHAPEVLRVQGVVSMEALGAFGIAVVRVSSSLYMEKAAEDIRKLPNVEYVEPNHPIWADQKETNYEYEHSFKDPIIPWGIREINVEEAWKKSKGSKDVIVCVVDSGVDVTHEDLEPNIWTNTDEIPGNGLDDDDNGWIDDVHGYDFENSDSDPTDDHSHGTHVAGIIGAVANNVKGIIGVSPTVSIMACKALNQELVGLMSNSVKCVQYCAANGAHIMTFSWGTFTYSSTLQKAIADVRSRGILVIASAGNTGNNNDLRPYYPACYDSDNLMAVASSDQQNNLSRFSSYGRNCVDIAAPGEEIVSAFPAYLLCNPRGICDPLPYRPKWGTSQSVPHVAGAAVLLKAAYPGFTCDVLKNLIIQSATKLPSLQGKCVSEGKLNVAAAFELAELIQ